jgi:hypothetical protein
VRLRAAKYSSTKGSLKIVVKFLNPTNFTVWSIKSVLSEKIIGIAIMKGRIVKEKNNKNCGKTNAISRRVSFFKVLPDFLLNKIFPPFKKPAAIDIKINPTAGQINSQLLCPIKVSVLYNPHHNVVGIIS